MKKYYFIYAAVLFLSLASGCASVPKDSLLARIEPAASKFKDIPVPKTFEYLKDGSYYLDSGITAVRIGTIRYQGRALLEKVKDFYVQQMPRYKWTLANTLEYGASMMHFSREKEDCLIHLSEDKDLVTIIINVGPKIENLLK